MEGNRRLRRIYAFKRRNVGPGIYLQKTLSQHFDLTLTNRGDRCHKLSVDIAHGHSVGVHNREMPYPRPYQGFGSPAAYATYAYHNHFKL